eukprot:TRINITY_DN2449_c0_g1_i1.p1 TRINITY_DN2449_c0_g1~~TRINITY_DN2449_c0_g1_i1.p1  ORF type:complete len:296 (+),score=83.86 TRINITY_DN2449_c0_g1_i1:237-1124(+)
MTSAPLVSLSPQHFVDFLKKNDISRCSFICVEGKMKASHEILQPIADWVQQDTRDYDQHEGIFIQVGENSGVLQSASVHRTNRGAGAGGVRNWVYDSVEDFLRDGMRLSRGMTHKNALAGIWWGGGKGVMARNSGQGLTDGASASSRQIVYEEYGVLMSSLKGCYITAEDAGTSVTDMVSVFARTRFTTCIPPSLGGSGNPSIPTAMGIIRGMEAALAHTGKGNLSGKKVVVQGMGHVGTPLVSYLLDKGVSMVIGSDIDPVLKDQPKKHLEELADFNLFLSLVATILFFSNRQI